MTSKAQRNATKMHRRRAAARGLVRLEVQAPKKDADLIRALKGLETPTTWFGKNNAIKTSDEHQTENKLVRSAV
jgi:hypothetical protein